MAKFTVYVAGLLRWGAKPGPGPLFQHRQSDRHQNAPQTEHDKPNFPYINPANCIAEDSIYLTALPRIEVYAPNVFMVNGPPEQAYFSLYPSKSVRIIRQFQVFDRWGNLQFSRSNALPGSNELLWDGYSQQGDLLPEAVYVWQALIEFSDGVVRDFSGNVLLVNGR